MQYKCLRNLWNKVRENNEGIISYKVSDQRRPHWGSRRERHGLPGGSFPGRWKTKIRAGSTRWRHSKKVNVMWEQETRRSREELREQTTWGLEGHDKDIGFYFSDDRKPLYIFYWLGIRLRVEKGDPSRSYYRSSSKRGLWPETEWWARPMRSSQIWDIF